MRTRSCVAVLLSAIALVACGPSSATSNSEPGGDGVFSLEDYFAEGERRVDRAMDRSDHRHFRAVAPRARRAVVRIRVDFSKRGGSFSSNHGSGVLVGDRRHVITVAHTLAPMAHHDDATIAIRFANGEETSAEALPGWRARVGDPGEDWAVLRLTKSAPVDPLDLAAVDLPGTRCMVLGYPARIGLSPDSGRIVQDVPTRTSPLEALRVLGEFQVRGRESVVVPAHGSIPIGGMSGGAVIDVRGRLIAIQRALNESSTDGVTEKTLAVSSIKKHAHALQALGLPVGE